VSSSTVRSHVLQTSNVVTENSSQVVLEGHAGHELDKAGDLGRGHGADEGGLVNRQLCAQTGGDIRTDSVETLNGSLIFAGNVLAVADSILYSSRWRGLWPHLENPVLRNVGTEHENHLDVCLAVLLSSQDQVVQYSGSCSCSVGLFVALHLLDRVSFPTRGYPVSLLHWPRWCLVPDLALASPCCSEAPLLFPARRSCTRRAINPEINVSLGDLLELEFIRDSYFGDLKRKSIP
jgi:hypothetical protein